MVHTSWVRFPVVHIFQLSNINLREKFLSINLKSILDNRIEIKLFWQERRSTIEHCIGSGHPKITSTSVRSVRFSCDLKWKCVITVCIVTIMREIEIQIKQYNCNYFTDLHTALSLFHFFPPHFLTYLLSLSLSFFSLFLILNSLPYLSLYTFAHLFCRFLFFYIIFSHLLIFSLLSFYFILYFNVCFL